MIYKKISKTNFILSFVFTFVLLGVFYPLWLTVEQLDAASDKARIDIYVRGGEEPGFDLRDGDIPLLPTGWMPHAGMQGYSLEKKDNQINLKILSKKNLKIFVDLRGPYVLKNPKDKSRALMPYWVDYRKLLINGGENVLPQLTSAWHNKPYKYEFSAQAGQEYDILIEWELSSHVNIWYHADYYMLIIFSVVAFLAVSKIVKYLTYFKVEQLKSRIDIVFVSVFFVFLFIPMMHVSEVEKSEQENRMLAKYVPLLQDGKINLKYGENFERWFNDRFWGRDILTDIFFKLQFNINRFYQNNRAIYDKKSGWMFNKPYVEPIPDDRKIASIMNGIRAFDKFCKENKIRFYIMIVPKKESIYQDELSVAIGYDKAKDEQFQRYVEKIKSSLDEDRVVYPYAELKKASETDYVFFKTSHHWTDWGAYIGYRSLMSKIKKDFSNVSVVSLKDYNKSESKFLREDFWRNYDLGHTVGLLKLRSIAEEKILKTNYNYYDNVQNLKVAIINEVGKFGKLFEFKKGSPHKLLMIGTSQNEDLSQFLPYSFYQTKYIRLNNVKNVKDEDMFKVMKLYRNDILNFSPDLIVFTIITGNIIRMWELSED